MGELTGCGLWFIEDFGKHKGRKESPQQKQPFWPGPGSGQGGVGLMGDQLSVEGRLGEGAVLEYTHPFLCRLGV